MVYLPHFGRNLGWDQFPLRIGSRVCFLSPISVMVRWVLRAQGNHLSSLSSSEIKFH